VAILGCLCGLFNNLLSARGIPMVGDWNRGYGVPSPGGVHSATYGNVEINLPNAYRYHKEGFVFIDARPLEGFREGHIPGAISVPSERSGALDDVVTRLLESGRPAVVYCQGMECDEAHLLAARLRRAGVEKISVFAGGLAEWKAAGYPVEREGDGR